MRRSGGFGVAVGDGLSDIGDDGVTPGWSDQNGVGEGATEVDDVDPGTVKTDGG
jgi:hypothetical protein